MAQSRPDKKVLNFIKELAKKTQATLQNQDLTELETLKCNLMDLLKINPLKIQSSSAYSDNEFLKQLKQIPHYQLAAQGNIAYAKDAIFKLYNKIESEMASIVKSKSSEKFFPPATAKKLSRQFFLPPAKLTAEEAWKECVNRIINTLIEKTFSKEFAFYKLKTVSERILDGRQFLLLDFSTDDKGRKNEEARKLIYKIIAEYPYNFILSNLKETIGEKLLKNTILAAEKNLTLDEYDDANPQKKLTQ